MFLGLWLATATEQMLGQNNEMISEQLATPVQQEWIVVVFFNSKNIALKSPPPPRPAEPRWWIILKATSHSAFITGHSFHRWEKCLVWSNLPMTH